VYRTGYTEIKYWINTLQITSQVRLVLLPDDPIELYTMFSKKSAVHYLSQFNVSVETLQRQLPLGTFKEEYFQEIF
jgi:hypothetical protein